jgi:hypothetical protein
MGYSIMLLKSKFLVRNEHHNDALKSIKALSGKETTGKEGELHFMWVRSNEFIEAATLEEALYAWRWSVVLNAAGHIIGIYEFRGEKYGDEDILFKAIAPFVDQGSFIMMAGEDGVIWRWLFHGSQVQKQFGRVVFDYRAEEEIRKRLRPDSEDAWPHFSKSAK